MDNGRRWAALYGRARPRGSVVVVGDARAVGLPDSTFHDRRRRERWEGLGGGAWLLPGATLTIEARRHAALAVLGEEALLSHRTALLIHDLTRWAEPDDRIHVVVPQRVSRRPPRLTRRHRSRRLGPEDRAVVDGFPVTTVARTLMDVAGETTAWRLEAMMLAARQRGRLVVDDVEYQFARRPTLRGAGRVRDASDVLRASSVDSVLEARALTLIRTASIAEPETQYRIRHAGRLVAADFAWPEAGVVLECDGRAFHAEDAFERDRERWNHMTAAGWELVWATWDRIHGDPDGLLRRLRDALGSFAVRSAPT